MKISVLVEDDAGRRYQGDSILSPQRDGNKSARSSQRVTSSHASGRPPKATHALKILFEKGKFRTEQNFGAIEKNLSALEYNFPKPTLMMALRSVPFLTRRGTKGNYHWIQKYKPGT